MNLVQEHNHAIQLDKERNFSQWDPLEAANGSDKEIISAAKKREIKNILKSYVGTYDPMSELLQNSMDAVEKRLAFEDNTALPKITININLQENSFQVIDNGCGFQEEQFKAFLAPNISFKKDQTSRGNKGVGATYIAYGFNELEIRTKNSEFQFAGKFRNGRQWVEDESGIVHRPQMRAIDDVDPLFDQVDQGTSIKIIFGGDHTRPADIKWFKASTPDQWLYLLLIKTPLGHIDFHGQVNNKIKFDLIVTDANGVIERKDNCEAQYKFPHEEIQASPFLKDIIAAQKKAVEVGRDPSKAVERFSQSNGIYTFFDAKELLSLNNFDDADKTLIEKYQISAYGYFAYSTSIWDSLNDTKAKLRKSYRILRGGLQMANNHMIQGELITIPLSKNIGHQNQTHVIVHFIGADPDLGRKGFQPELKKLSENISVMLVKTLSDRRNLLKNDTGEKPNIEKQIKLHEWIREQEDHEKSNPLVLINDNFFLPTRKISVQSEPLSEQDVIVLFNQLLAGGVIRGIKLLSTSQNSQYDGIFRFVADEPFENLTFDAHTNPLGVYEGQLGAAYEGPPQILEYKFSLDGLIREFENGVKREKDISLAVFWDFGKEYQNNYTVTSLLDFNNIQHREHHGITHIIKSQTSHFSAVCLKELISLLNDSDSEQINQQSTYGIII